jgi:hypothetical protein
MARIFRDSGVLNQFGSPSLNSNSFANRPTPGQAGRLFVSTDTLAIFRDTGTAWDNLTDNPGNIGTLQEVTTNGNQTTLSIEILARESLFSKTFDTSDIGGDATNIINIGSNVNLSSNVLGVNNIFSESYKTITSNVTFESDSHIDNTYIYNAISNNSLSSKIITVTQGSYINALSGLRIQSIFNNINSLTVSHYASIIVNPLTTTNNTIENYYGLLINNSTASSITNRWGIYQAGANDKNFFGGIIQQGNTSGAWISLENNSILGRFGAGLNDFFIQSFALTFLTNGNYTKIFTTGNLVLGSNTVDTGRKLQVNGQQEWITTVATGAHTTSGNHLPVWVNGVQYWLALLNPVLP